MEARMKLARLLCAGAAAAGALLAAPAAAQCTPVTIYFDWNSADLTPPAREALEALAVRLAWKEPDLDALILTSHTDSSGSAEANHALAARRAEAVRAALIGHSIDADIIETRIFGERRPRVATPTDAREPENRRVELLLQLSADAQAEALEEERPLC
jgi:outer membrane protein OmpA-like peptidoglycan-associated protein